MAASWGNAKDQMGVGTANATGSRFVLGGAFLVGLVLVSGCALFYGRPVQQMSDTSAAIRAAKEVQADSLVPDVYREATEWYFKARREYRFKNFKLASDYAQKARQLAERAEFEALRKGGIRTESAPPLEVPPTPSPYAYPTPEGTPADGPAPDATSPPNTPG